MELTQYHVVTKETVSRTVRVMADDRDKIPSLVSKLWLNDQLRAGVPVKQGIEIVQIIPVENIQGSF